MSQTHRGAAALLAATVVNLPFGTLYAFSVFLKPMEALLCATRAEMGFVFGLATVTLTVGMPSELPPGSSGNDFVCRQQHRARDHETERLGCSLVDHELERGWLLDREVGRLGALEDAVDVLGCSPQDLAPTGAIGDQAAFLCEIP